MDQDIESFVKNRLDATYFEQFDYVYQGGKRIRPLIIQKLCTKYGKQFEPLIPAAASIELLHCATLVHDDILDDETQRRGKKPFYKAYGLHKAIAFGDFFFSLANEVLLETAAFQKIQVEFMRTLKHIIDGQIMELEDRVVDLNSYLTYIEKKTASLFALCTRVPYFYYDLKDPEILEFGKEFGLLFQIANDLATPNEKCNIQNFMSELDARTYYEKKYTRVQTMNILDLTELPLTV